MAGFLAWLFGDADRYDIDKINLGDTMDQVRALFGQPDGIRKYDFGTGGLKEEWEYTIPFRLFVSIDFGPDRKVAAKYRSG